MNAATQARYEARARVIKAMGHPSRLLILDELAKGERCVCELTDLVGADMSTVSRHLDILKSAGIIREEKRGSQVFHTLQVPCVLKFMNCIESVLKANAQAQLAFMK